MTFITIPLLAVLSVFVSADMPEAGLFVATFQADVTPPIGSPIDIGLDPPAKKISDPLTARGIVLFTGDSPIVLCAVDWVGINNTANDAWREALAEAAGTTTDRVSVHVLHQHTAPGIDFLAEKYLAANGLGGAMFDPVAAREAIAKTAEALRSAMDKRQQVTHIGTGKGKVEKFASNRRILNPDGSFKYWRGSSCRDEKVRAEPEGVIDPYVSTLSFWNGDGPVVSITYYATHPQSFYGRGAVSSDTVGIARGIREATLPDTFHIHFNGAGGNIAAGKYNDGSPPNRLTLAERFLEGMEAAWKDTVKVPITANDVEWRVLPVALPLRKSLVDEEDKIRQTLANPDASLGDRIRSAGELAWIERCRSGHEMDLFCLRVGPAYVLHMPGELFIEYQLAAQEMKPDNTVFMAAYADCGSWYICTEIAYSQGGYEAGAWSWVAPEVESILMAAMRKLLE